MEKMDKFLQWLEVNGVQLCGCKLSPCNSEEGFGLYSANNNCGGVLLVAPLRLAITPMTILQDPSLGSEYGKLFEEGDVDDRFLIILFLLVERAREVSFWSPYLDMLPSTFGTPLWFTEDEFSELKGTALYHAAKLQLKNLKALFDDRVKHLVESFLLLIGVPFREILFEDFLWANSIFWTRALNIPCSRSFVFPSQLPVQDGHDCQLHENHTQSTEDDCSSGSCHILSSGSSAENLPMSEQSTTVWVEGLVPGIDFCNHDPKAKALWDVDDENGSITGVPFSMYLITGPNVTFPPEEEIRISYGSKGNEVHYPKEALQQIDFTETKSLLLQQQNLQLRWLLPESLLRKGNSNESSLTLDGCMKDSSQVLGYSWSGHRKLPSYMDHFVFPEDLMAALRTIAMKEENMHAIMSLLKELSESGCERQPSEEDIKAAIWEVCGNAGSLQLLVDLLTAKIMELEEGSGTEVHDTELLDKFPKTILSPEEQHAELSDRQYKRPETECSMQKNIRAAIIYRRGQKHLAHCFLEEAQNSLQLCLSEE
ncbi:uncharacterized protein LOC131074771 isoform X2 [Cryptomeria japonica]|uniref:uncharacterized protein LOC131074771 isoform X2 n=1 Tax=Cryptomeria japonica TaxID=3369 RepID=UPI0027D9ED29|nr:uncharacterized protein LOC131074771 isoform X2 [Cryptomeria japonica]